MFARQHGERSSSWKQPDTLRRLQSWGGPGFKGFVVTVRWGRKDSPRPTQRPQRTGGMGPAALSWGQAAFSFSGLGGIQGSEPGGQMGESTAILGQSSCCLSSSLPSSLPRKIPARNWGLWEASVHTKGAAPFLQPLFQPQPRFPSHHPARGALWRLSWQGWLGARMGRRLQEPDCGGTRPATVSSSAGRKTVRD